MRLEITEEEIEKAGDLYLAKSRIGIVFLTDDESWLESQYENVFVYEYKTWLNIADCKYCVWVQKD